jgi:hypothetical protein
VNSTAGPVFFDANTLMSFAVVARLDLLEVRFSGRARWITAVQIEVQRGVAVEPGLTTILTAKWLGDPLEVSGIKGIKQVDLIRRALGGVDSAPLQHLGEAETIYCIEKSGSPESVFVTDDKPAADFASRRGIRVINTAKVLAECHSMDEIGCPDAYDLLLGMADQGRGVEIPPDHTYVC